MNTKKALSHLPRSRDSPGVRFAHPYSNGRGVSIQSIKILQEQKEALCELLSITDTHLFEKKNKTEKSMLGRKQGQEMPFEIF